MRDLPNVLVDAEFGLSFVARQALSELQPCWLLGLKDRRGVHKTIVAFANKMARIAWAVIAGDADYERTRAFKAQPPRRAGQGQVADCRDSCATL